MYKTTLNIKLSVAVLAVFGLLGLNAHAISYQDEMQAIEGKYQVDWSRSTEKCELNDPGYFVDILIEVKHNDLAATYTAVGKMGGTSMGDLFTFSKINHWPSWRYTSDSYGSNGMVWEEARYDERKREFFSKYEFMGLSLVVIPHKHTVQESLTVQSDGSLILKQFVTGNTNSECILIRQ